MTTRIKPCSPLLALALLLAVSSAGCQDTGGVDKSEVEGLTTRTFIDENGNVGVTVATDGTRTIVAVPKAAVGRRNQMGNDETKCLAKCVKIDDLEKRLNCILACPTTSNYQVFTY